MKRSRHHQQMRSEPSDQNFPAIESVTRCASVGCVTVNCIVPSDHEISLVVAGLQPTAGRQHVPTRRVQRRLELLLAALDRVHEHARVGADEHLRDFPDLLEGNPANRGRPERQVLHRFRLVPRDVAFVDGHVAPLEPNRHALSILGHSQRGRLLQVRLHNAQAGWNRFVDFV